MDQLSLRAFRAQGNKVFVIDAPTCANMLAKASEHWYVWQMTALVRFLPLFFCLAILTGCGGSSGPAEAALSGLPQSATSRVLNGDSYTDTDPVDTPAQVFRLYRAAFDRESDSAGLGYHIAAIESSGLSLSQVAANFIASPEFSSSYGNLSTADFVVQLYKNVLKRAPDAAGLAFHVGNISSGQAKRQDVLVGFSESPENKTLTASAILTGIRFDVYPPLPGRNCLLGQTSDAFGNMNMKLVNTIGTKPYACRTVNMADGYPAFDGAESVRFQLAPGDCGSNSGFNDCLNSRSRVELSQQDPAPTNGKYVTFEARLFIPRQTGFAPEGDNVLFLSQLNAGSASQTVLAYLEVLSSGALAIRTHKGLTYDVEQRLVVIQDPQDQWIKYRVEVASTTAMTGTLKIFVNDNLVINQVRATLPDTSSTNDFRVGIYGSFFSSVTEQYSTRVIYFDSLKTSMN